MSVEFSNAYQEILLENLMAVIKQNFLFQTQLKMNDGLEKQKNQLSVELTELKNQFENIKNQASQVDIYKMKAEQNNSAHEEKSRIQSALNDELKKNDSLQKELKNNILKLNEQQKEIDELKNKISKLEELVPVTKLKKLNKEEKTQISEVLDPQPIKSKQETKAVIDKFIPVSLQGSGTF